MKRNYGGFGYRLVEVFCHRIKNPDVGDTMEAVFSERWTGVVLVLLALIYAAGNVTGNGVGADGGWNGRMEESVEVCDLCCIWKGF